jgi:hypothetical protein
MTKKIIFIIILFVLPTAHFANIQNQCPTDPLVLKKVLEKKLAKNPFENCTLEIVDHITSGDPKWLSMALFLREYYSFDMIAVLGDSLSKNPLDTFEVINQSDYLIKQLGYICHRSVFTDNEEEINKIHTLLSILETLKDTPQNLQPLRESCISYIKREEVRIRTPEAICPKTPDDTAALIKQDAGISLTLSGEKCIESIFKHIRLGETKWLALASVILNYAPDRSLVDFLQDSLFVALPHNSEGTLKIIAQYFPERVNDICYSSFIAQNYNSLDGGDSSFNMDIPAAIKGLKDLKIKEPKLAKARDQCLAGLVDTLKTADVLDEE